jgi:hypothetical protein
VAEAHSNRAELEFQRVLYRIRDDTVQLLLDRMRSSHEALSATIAALEEISTSNSRAGLRITSCPFSRALISDDDLETMLDDFEGSFERGVDLQYPSFLELVSRPVEEIEDALFDRSRALFQALPPRSVSDYIQAARCDLDAALIWMRHASRPWFPCEASQPDEVVLVIADYSTWGNGPLHAAFAGAQWIGSRTTDSAAVLRVQPIGTFDQVRAYLRGRGILPAAKTTVAQVTE